MDSLRLFPDLIFHLSQLCNLLGNFFARKRSSGPWPPQGTLSATPYQAATVDFQQQYYSENEHFDASCTNDKSFSTIFSGKNGRLPVRQTVIDEVCNYGYLDTVGKLEGYSSSKRWGCSIVDNNLEPYIVSTSVMMAVAACEYATDTCFVQTYT